MSTEAIVSGFAAFLISFVVSAYFFRRGKR